MRDIDELAQTKLIAIHRWMGVFLPFQIK